MSLTADLIWDFFGGLFTVGAIALGITLMRAKVVSGWGFLGIVAASIIAGYILANFPYLDGASP